MLKYQINIRLIYFIVFATHAIMIWQMAIKNSFYDISHKKETNTVTNTVTNTATNTAVNIELAESPSKLKLKEKMMTPFQTNQQSKPQNEHSTKTILDNAQLKNNNMPIEKKTIQISQPKEIKKPQHIKQNSNAKNKENNFVNSTAAATSTSTPILETIHKKTTEQMPDVYKPIAAEKPTDHKLTTTALPQTATIAKTIKNETIKNELAEHFNKEISKPIPQTATHNNDTSIDDKNDKNEKARYLGGKPSYPEASRLNEETGTVELEVQIDETGKPQHIKVLKSSGFYRLDTAVQAHIKTAKFQPAIKNSQKQASTLVLRFIYNLDD